MDQSVDELRTPWQRLRWARHRWQRGLGISPNAAAAAESLGIEPHTYRSFEGPEDRSKFTPLNHQRAIEFGRKFKVSWVWLLTGEGAPDRVELNEPQQRIVTAMRDATDEKQQAIADVVERMLKAM
jgi:hypothetical protein